jgi:hypothetical protein
MKQTYGKIGQTAVTMLTYLPGAFLAHTIREVWHNGLVDRKKTESGEKATSLSLFF